jgi:hypothetical protein
MGFAELKKLSDRQLRACSQILMDRHNKKAREKVNSVLSEQVEAIAKALTSPPFVYTSPPIKIMPGCEARLSTLVNDQLMDAHQRVDEFMRDGSPNDIRVSHELNMNLIAHSLYEFNGVEFGGVSMPDDYHLLVVSSPRDARDAMKTVRDSRVQALRSLPPHVFQRLVEVYQAFQAAMDDITMGEELGEALGN